MGDEDDDDKDKDSRPWLVPEAPPSPTNEAEDELPEFLHVAPLAGKCQHRIMVGQALWSWMTGVGNGAHANRPERNVPIIYS